MRRQYHVKEVGERESHPQGEGTEAVFITRREEPKVVSYKRATDKSSIIRKERGRKASSSKRKRKKASSSKKRRGKVASLHRRRESSTVHKEEEEEEKAAPSTRRKRRKRKQHQSTRRGALPLGGAVCSCSFWAVLLFLSFCFGVVLLSFMKNKQNNRKLQG